MGTPGTAGRPCASYADARLARVYDPLNLPAEDDTFYLGLAGERPWTVMDVGCGTGRLASRFAALGHDVTGVEPALAMLDIARRRDGGTAVTWVQADAASLDLDRRFDLIVMTGHVFQVFLEDEAVLAALVNLCRHLAPAGRLAFETRNPAVREWETWVPQESMERVTVPGAGEVYVHYDIAAVEGELVTFETHFRFADGETIVAPQTLRFMGQERLDAFLTEAGLADVAWYGSWGRSAWLPASPDILVVAS